MILDGEVVFDRGVLTFVGRGYGGEVAERHDFGNALVAPGLIDLDALSDLDTTVLSFDNHPAWRKGRVWPRSYVARGPTEMYSEAELAFQKRYAFQALLRNGITTALPIASLFYRAWGETTDEFAAAADAAVDLGLRVYLGPAYRTGNPVVEDDGTITLAFDEPRGLAGLAEAVRFCRDHEGRAGGLIRTMLAPDRIETCTEALLRWTAAAGRDLDVPVRLHCCQGDFEVATVRRLHGRTPIRWLHDLGFLSPNVLLPHGTHVDARRADPRPDDDLGLVAEAGASVVHCPLVAARFGKALDSFAHYRARGLKLGLGTDTAPADLVANMQVGLLTCRIAEGDPEACRASDYFDAATLGGGRRSAAPISAGSAPGCRADLAVFDLGLPHQHQTIDPVQTLLLTGRGPRRPHRGGGRVLRHGGPRHPRRRRGRDDEGGPGPVRPARRPLPEPDVAAPAGRRDLPAELPGLEVMPAARRDAREDALDRSKRVDRGIPGRMQPCPRCSRLVSLQVLSSRDGFPGLGQTSIDTETCRGSLRSTVRRFRRRRPILVPWADPRHRRVDSRLGAAHVQERRAPSLIGKSDHGRHDQKGVANALGLVCRPTSPATRQEGQQVGRHEEEGTRHVHAHRGELELQRRRGTEEEAGQDRAADAPLAEDDGRDGEVTRTVSCPP